MKKCVLLTIALSALAHAEDIKLEWRGSGVKSLLSFYYPVPITLAEKQPASVKKIPEGVVKPQFGTVKLGPAESAQEFVVMLEERDDDHSRLWMDGNGNGDLTDDAPTTWASRNNVSRGVETTLWDGAIAAEVAYGTAKRQLSLNVYRFGKGDNRQASRRDTIFSYRDYALSGQVTIGAKSYKAVLSDDTSRGDFRGNGGKGTGASLLLDLNGDARFDLKAERFNVNTPFNIAGVTYEIAGMTADGSSFQINESSKKVEEKAVPPSLLAGDKPVAFDEKTTDGKRINFPADFKGRLVMLDFWATWCGPCKAELRGLTKVYQEFHDKGFDVIGISLDNEQSLPKLAKFLEGNHMSWPQIADGQGWDSKLAGAYGVHGIPAAWLVDGNTGLIVAANAGLRGEALRETIESGLKNLGKQVAATPEPAAPAPIKDQVIKSVLELAKNGGATSAEAFLAQLNTPKPAKLVLQPLSTAPMRGRQIAERAALSHVRVGWVYQCSKCSQWHQSLAGGYAIAKDAIVSAYHVMAAPERMKPGQGYPVVMLADDRILPVSAVLAADRKMDAVVLRIAGANLQPLALSTDIRPGDSAYCLSDPLGKYGYFSEGIVNRLLADDPDAQHLNVSTDWAQGSSGAAVLDECGNVIGHVARIEPMLNPKNSTTTNAGASENRATVLTLHEAVSSASVLALIDRMNAAAGSR